MVTHRLDFMWKVRVRASADAGREGNKQKFDVAWAGNEKVLLLYVLVPFSRINLALFTSLRAVGVEWSRIRG